jgi:hypothetical protein
MWWCGLTGQGGDEMYRIVRSGTGTTHAVALFRQGNGAPEEPRTVCGRLLASQAACALSSDVTCLVCQRMLDVAGCADDDHDLYGQWLAGPPQGHQVGTPYICAGAAAMVGTRETLVCVDCGRSFQWQRSAHYHGAGPRRCPGCYLAHKSERDRAYRARREAMRR